MYKGSSRRASRHICRRRIQSPLQGVFPGHSFRLGGDMGCHERVAGTRHAGDKDMRWLARDNTFRAAIACRIATFSHEGPRGAARAQGGGGLARARKSASGTKDPPPRD